MNFQRLFVRYTARPHQQLLALVAFAIFSITFVSPCLAATDVYVVFSGSESNALKKAVSASLKKALKVKTYNVDMLALADYSGKQKVIAKFSRATVVVFLGDRPLNELKGASFGAHMVITSGAGDDLSTDKIKVYAISKGTDTSAVSSGGSVVQVSTASSLAGDLKSGSVYVIDSALPMNEALTALVNSLIGK